MAFKLAMFPFKSELVSCHCFAGTPNIATFSTSASSAWMTPACTDITYTGIRFYFMASIYMRQLILDKSRFVDQPIGPPIYQSDFRKQECKMHFIVVRKEVLPPVAPQRQRSWIIRYRWLRIRSSYTVRHTNCASSVWSSSEGRQHSLGRHTCRNGRNLRRISIP